LGIPWNDFWYFQGMDLLLRCKHWQLFLLVVGIPLVLQLVQNILLVWTQPQSPGSFSSLLGLLVIIPLFIYFIWIYSVGKKFNEGILGLFVSILGHIFLLIYFWSYSNWVNQAEGEEVLPISLLALIVFISFFTLFYALSFMAKALVQMERGTNIHSSEFYSEFIMALLFPLGIWLLQPRINRQAMPNPGDGKIQ
jgi:hypothetical protein